MSILTRTKTAADDAGNIADHAAESAHTALRSTQSATNAAFDRMNDKVDVARDHASPVIDRWSNQAETAMRRSLDAVRQTSAQLRDRANYVSDATASRVRDEPLKAVLIAAAAGAVMMGLVSLLRSRRRDVR
jgi:ElaB/YqjD/DUF883 family membrane-anchored ribosome-binding protein